MTFPLLCSGETTRRRVIAIATPSNFIEAIRLQPAQRDALLPKLGRQYLWDDQPEKAIQFLNEYLEKHPEACDTRLVLALAYSNVNRLGKSKRSYSEVAGQCAALGPEARLGEAKVLRWMDRPGPADAIYKRVEGNGTAAQKRDAQTGRALLQLDRDNNRTARAMFAKLSSVGAPEASVVEGQGVSELRLGLPDKAFQVVRLADKNGLHSRSLSDLDEHLRLIDRFALSPLFAGFRDSDGTRYRSEEIITAFGWRKRTQGEMHLGDSSLRLNDQTINGRWAGAAIDHRFNESFALRAEGRLNDFLQANFRPGTGELDAVWTPRDSLRVDAALGRILIADNLAALDHHLIGTYASIGMDQRWKGQNTISVSLDTTRWSEGNTRMRYRFNLSHRFEGVPRLTVEWPTSFQTYNKGFSFGLFSPRAYLETGPGVNVYRRYARYWTVSLSARMGAQKESTASWQKLGAFSAVVERELWKRWAVHGSASYSSSNLASPTGFKRKSLSVGVTRRF